VELGKAECPEVTAQATAAPVATAPAVTTTAAKNSPYPRAIQNLAGKDAKNIAAILGKPTTTEKTKYGPKMIYVSLSSGMEWEIVYINGKADWFTITPSPLRPVPFNAAAITAIGLQQEQPTSSTLQVIRWENIQGLRSVTFYSGGQNVDYCYVKAKTP